jgi:hypothetical protein
MRVGRVLGIVLSVLGVIASGALAFQLANHGAVFRIMMAGPPLVTMGLAMIALPGADIHHKDDAARGGHEWWTETPVAIRVVWVVAGAVGLVVSFAAVF